MWLLSTNRAELKFYSTPEDVPGGYAILSHVWDHHEETFQDVRSLGELRMKTGQSPRDLVGPKIRESCMLAERHGWAWIWIDTCCIDKTSSAELSEAINSMFRYYSLSAVCYAFLRDVPDSHSLDREGSAFRRSKWHKRGWTLQELVAPKLVIFVSREWTVLGDKAELSALLQDVTNIPARILIFDLDLAEISVARRMSWAAPRETTRSEDEAYCLMGIFGINMPTLYGEGRKAFYRLQEEIMKSSIDTSLYLWGQLRFLPSLSAELSNTAPKEHEHFSAGAHLLAESPRSFADSRTAEFNVRSITHSQRRLNDTKYPMYRQGLGLRI